MRVRTVAPDRLPASAAGYRDDDALVLDDVPGDVAEPLSDPGARRRGAHWAAWVCSCSAARTASRSAATRSRHSQQLLPVRSLVPGNLQRRNVAVELVLDRSGSMIDLAGGVPKIVMAQSGRAADRSSSSPSTMISSGSSTSTSCPTPSCRYATRLDAAADRVDNTVDGAARQRRHEHLPRLEGGLAQLSRSHAQERHIILMTDGISQPENYAPLLAQLRQARITVATVALGADADRKLLAQIAAATGGHAYVTDNAHELPKIFAKETPVAAKPVRVRGRLAVSRQLGQPGRAITVSGSAAGGARERRRDAEARRSGRPGGQRQEVDDEPGARRMADRTRPSGDVDSRGRRPLGSSVELAQSRCGTTRSDGSSGVPRPRP